MSEDETKDAGEMVELGADIPSPPFEIVAAKYDDCKHSRTIVNETFRRVVCASCETDLDAFSVLLEIAKGSRRAYYTREQAFLVRSEIKVAEKRLEDIERRERNAKARLRKAERADEVNKERRRILSGISGAVQALRESPFAERMSADFVRGFDVLASRVAALVGGPDVEATLREISQIHIVEREAAQLERKRARRKATIDGAPGESK